MIKKLKLAVDKSADAMRELTDRFQLHDNVYPHILHEIAQCALEGSYDLWISQLPERKVNLLKEKLVADGFKVSTKFIETDPPHPANWELYINWQ